jgi:hypothetical protein
VVSAKDREEVAAKREAERVKRAMRRFMVAPLIFKGGPLCVGRRENFFEILENSGLDHRCVVLRGREIELQEIDERVRRSFGGQLLIEGRQFESRGFDLGELDVSVFHGFFGIGKRIHGWILSLNHPIENLLFFFKRSRMTVVFLPARVSTRAGASLR